MKRILVYPCGTEIGLEIYKSLIYSKQYELWGGSSTYDHGRFIYKRHIDNLPFIRDDSDGNSIQDFIRIIDEYHFDYIYPAMDGVLTVLSKYRYKFEHIKVIAPDYETNIITRSKKKTYALMKDIIPIPCIYNSIEEVKSFPIFVKPDCGQGSVGARKVISYKEAESIDWSRDICLEYLPGEEFTVDCFTNQDGKLIYVNGRKRNRIKNGISVNAQFYEKKIFNEYAEAINTCIRIKGGWFFQIKESDDGTLKLMEISSRIAGTSAISRCVGVNLPLLTVNIFDGIRVDDIVLNTFEIELDRALSNAYKIDLNYKEVFLDYDDTVVLGSIVNPMIIAFIFQCHNHGIRVILLSRHKGSLDVALSQQRLSEIFDEIIHISDGESKAQYISTENAIFIDDSYGERKDVYSKCGIPTFDTNMIECLLEF